MTVERRSRETRETRAAAREESCLSRLALSVTRVVICVSRAFCSTDQEKRETPRSLIWNDGRGGVMWQQEGLAMGLSATLRVLVWTRLSPF